MANKCENCAEKCLQAEMARNAALGRMYATKEFVALLKKVENGELVEAVRCKECKHRRIDEDYVSGHYCVKRPSNGGYFCEDNDFCSYGERRTE